jgi:hypothetical protein
MMAGWNAMFHKAEPFKYDASRDSQWNRGAYLVETLGHCSACHTERNVLGAEKGGAAHLSGGFADGWEAPALNALAKGPVGWTEDAFFDYLRKGTFEPARQCRRADGRRRQGDAAASRQRHTRNGQLPCEPERRRHPGQGRNAARGGHCRHQRRQD